MQKKAGRPTKPRLSRAQILMETIALLKHAETEPSMRALATHLGVDPMAVYHYFPDREALWQAALEEVFADLPLAPPAGAPWQDAAMQFLLAYHQIALRNFRLTHFLVTHGTLRVAAIDAYNHALMQILDRAGFSPKRTELLRDLLVDYLHGYLMAEVHYSPREKKKRLQQVPVTLRWMLDCLR
ncbi:MAG: TetR/AcrR family transcriptional regulator [Turneriella sp.]|nr:TetR/AcrR family transcriptional regulator [Turneriella sp.]